ncbi:MAG: DNA internalization-related competence protein ComEC/Rec2 [Planctomycetes bacterium B3_Pla]|nr:MAG: DNA internalization-related competence protein ComEC/Rec2 [Planctomycetes bacterium B3_Pla]
MDEIKRKLALIDKQLAGRSFHKQAVTTCPLVFVAVGLMLGIFAQSRFSLQASIWLAPLGVLAAATAIFFVIQQFSRGNYQYVTAYLALGCFACLGAIRLTSYCRPESNDIRNFVADKPAMATIRGVIITEPQVSQYPDWEFARFKHTDPTSSFYIAIGEVKTAAGWAKATGTARVQVGEPVLELEAGDRIQAYCWLDRFMPPSNPGQFDVAAYLARRNVFVSISIESRAGIELRHSLPAGAFARLTAQIRQAATRALLGDLPGEGSSRGLLEALLLGNRRDVDSDTYRAFRRTGLLHLISLSGMHLGILFGIIWLAAKTAGLMKRSRAMICAIAVGIFLMIVPPRAPTIRAAIICWAFCASLLLRRRPNPINTLSLAAIVLLLIRPTQLFEAGWQLSFVSVLTIILFTKRIEAFLNEQLTDRLPSAKILTAGSALLRLFAVGLAAWLGSAGILLYHFYTITPLASIWTVLVFPLVSAVLALGFLKMILFFLLPTLSAVLGVAVAFMSDVLIWIVEAISRLDISEILIGRVSAVPVIFYYCIVVFAGYVYFRRPLIKRAICAVMLVSLFVYLGAAKWQRTHRDDLVLTCLDVGHGQAILVRLPGKTNILFDAGSLHRSDVGTRIVAPFLDYRGISKINAIVISHNDTDHINGIPEIVKHCKVDNVYANDAFFSRTDRWGTVKFLEECLDEQGFKIKRLEGNLRSGGATIETLWPDRDVQASDGLSDNDTSLVSLVEFAGVRILLCSDIEEFAQRELLGLHPDLKADIVVVPHHGSAKTLDAGFLEKLNADVLICSSDRSQYERTIHSTGHSLAASNVAGRFYTARDGAVTVTVGTDGTIKTTLFAK